MSAVDEGLRAVMRTVRPVEEVAASTRLLALNARIEAARSGEHGQGFVVVATEITKLADQSRGTSRDITDGMERLSADLQRTASGLRELASSDRLLALVARSSEGSENLAGHIARAIQRLQFQDAINQRLDHVLSAMRRIVETLEPLVRGVPKPGGARRAGAHVHHGRGTCSALGGGEAVGEETDGHVELS